MFCSELHLAPIFGPIGYRVSSLAKRRRPGVGLRCRCTAMSSQQEPQTPVPAAYSGHHAVLRCTYSGYSCHLPSPRPCRVPLPPSPPLSWRPAACCCSTHSPGALRLLIAAYSVHLISWHPLSKPIEVTSEKRGRSSKLTTLAIARRRDVPVAPAALAPQRGRQPRRDVVIDIDVQPR